MIIGISGRMGAGKDSLGMVIQALTMDPGVNTVGSHWHDNPLEYVTAYVGRPNLKGGWKIVKFADKLKQIASMLTGIPREDFEKQEVKDSLLGPEWNCWRVYFVRDHTLSNDEQYGVDFLTKNEAIMWEASERRALQWPPRVKTEIREHQMTVREFLQKLGTEGLRNGLHSNVWVNALFADYKPEHTTTESILNRGLREGDKDWQPGRMPNWIITDVRFPNEAQAISERGGIIVRIDRPDNPIPPAGHKSETALKDWNFDMNLVNNGRYDESFLYCAQRVLSKVKSEDIRNSGRTRTAREAD